MIYFGQEVGEDSSEEAGFGDPTRTSIFDYVGVPAHQRWVNNKQFDGGLLTDQEKTLRDFYKRLLNFTITSSALAGEYQDIHLYNRKHTEGYTDKLLSFVRWSATEKLIVVSNFDADNTYSFSLKIPKNIIDTWHFDKSNYKVEDQLYQQFSTDLIVDEDFATLNITLNALESFILKVQ